MKEALSPTNTGKAIGKAIKSITDADRNQMHLDRLEDIAENFTDDEAAIVAEKLMEKYPDIIFTVLRDRYEKLMHVNQAFMDVVKGGK